MIQYNQTCWKCILFCKCQTPGVWEYALMPWSVCDIIYLKLDHRSMFFSVSTSHFLECPAMHNPGALFVYRNSLFFYLFFLFFSPLRLWSPRVNKNEGYVKTTYMWSCPNSGFRFQNFVQHYYLTHDSSSHLVAESFFVSVWLHFNEIQPPKYNI